MALPIQIIVGGSGPNDPVVGATQYRNTALAGLLYYVSSSGYGPLPYTRYTLVSSGGFDLVGYQFSKDETYFVHLVTSEATATSNYYTNGFHYSRVMSELLPRIGFKQSTIAGYNIVSSNNLESKSGRWFDDFHSLVTVKNIKETIEDSAISDVNFDAHLETLKRAAIMRSLSSVLNVTEQIERVLLYDSLVKNRKAIANTNKFVGYQINTSKKDSYSVQVEAATLLFDTDVTFTLYLFKDGKQSPVWSQEVSAVANEATVVTIDNLVLNYIGQATKGSCFYLGYFQSELGAVKAIEEQPEFSQQICFCAQPFYSAATDAADFDRDNGVLTSTPFGINLEITSFRDHTNAVIKQGHLLDNLVGLTMAYMVLEQIIYAARSNANERILKEQLDKAGLLMDLNGAAPISDGPKISSLKDRIAREAERVHKEFYPKPKAQTVNACYY